MLARVREYYLKLRVSFKKKKKNLDLGQKLLVHYQTLHLMGKMGQGGRGDLKKKKTDLEFSLHSVQQIHLESLDSTGTARPVQLMIPTVLYPDTHTTQLWLHTERHLAVLSYRITSSQWVGGNHSHQFRKVLLLPWSRKIYMLPQNQLFC